MIEEIYQNSKGLPEPKEYATKKTDKKSGKIKSKYPKSHQCPYGLRAKMNIEEYQ